MFIIQTQGLTKHYNEQSPALENVDFSVREGEIVGLVGPVGSGKSSLIRILATLVEPNSGEAKVAGMDVAREARAVREKIGFMSDLFGVYDDMIVGEFMDFYARAHGLQPPDVADRLEELLNRVGLEGRLDHYIDRLDREMKQRLALAKTLINDPPILLIDEPCMRLSPPARIRMRELVGEVAREGKTLVLTTNILADLTGLCDRIGVMRRGRLVKMGPADEIRQWLAGSRRIEMRLTTDQSGPACERLLEQPHILKVLSDRHCVVFYTDFQGDNTVEWIEEMIRRLDLPVKVYRELELDLEMEKFKV